MKVQSNNNVKRKPTPDKNFNYNSNKPLNKPEIMNPERFKIIEEQKTFAETQKVSNDNFNNSKTIEVETESMNMDFKKKSDKAIYPEHGVRYKKDGTIDKRYIKKDGSLSTERVRSIRKTPEESKASRLANSEKAHQAIRDKTAKKFEEAEKKHFIQIIPIDSDPVEEIEKLDRSSLGLNIHKIEEYAEDIVLFKKVKNIIRNGIQINSSETNKLINKLTKFMEKYLSMVDDYDKFLVEYFETLDKYDECKKKLEVVKTNTTERK